MYSSQGNNDESPHKDCLRILYMTSQVSPQSGATFAMVHLVEAVQRYGAWVLIIAPLSKELKDYVSQRHIAYRYINLISLRASRRFWENTQYVLFFIPHLISLIRAIKSNRIDIVDVNEVTDILGMVAAKLAARPCVVHIRAHFNSHFLSKVLLSIVRVFANRAVVPSESVARWVRVTVPTLSSRISIIHDVALDPSEFRSDLDGNLLREELKVASNAPIVLMVSKLARLKGHLVFLEAVALVASRHPDAVFVVVGDVMTNHYREAASIREKAASLRYKNIPIFTLGYRSRDEIPHIYAAADICVHCPIYDDPFPTVIVEAMMMGKPVIGSHIGGITEQIEDNVTGLLVTPGNSDDLALAISRLIEDPALRICLGNAAEKYARTHYVATVQARDQILCYEDLCNIKRSSTIP